MTEQELRDLIENHEDDRVEFTISTSNTDKFCKAVCAFANDMPRHKQSGHLIIGVDNNGKFAGLSITDEILRNLTGVRDDGNIQPLEIQSPGGLYGEASVENFPRQTSYRNPIIAEAMKALGYVNRFGRGVIRAQESLLRNGSPAAEFEFTSSFVLAIIRRRA